MLRLPRFATARRPMRAFGLALALLVGTWAVDAPAWAAWAAAAPTDVKSDNPNYAAIKRLVDAGILTLGPNGTFNPDQPVDRATLAAALARVIDQLASGQVSASSQDIGTIRKLAEQYHDELVQYYQRLNQVDQQTQTAQKSVAATEEKLNQVLSALGDLQQREKAVEDALPGLKSAIDQLRQDVNKNGDSDNASRQDLLNRITQVQNKVDQLAGETKKSIDSLNQANQTLTTQTGALGSRVGTLETQVKSNTSDLAALKKAALGDIGQLKQSTQNTSQDLGDLHKSFDTLQAASQITRQDLDALRQSLDAQQQGLQQQLADLFVKLRGLIDDGDRQNADQIAQVKASVADVQKALAAQQTATDQLQQALTKQGQALQNADGQLLASYQALSDQVSALKTANQSLGQAVATLQEQLQAMQDKVGLSQEQLDKIQKDVQAKLAEQLNLNLVREQQLERQLADLQTQFNSYRDQQSQATSGAKTLGQLGLAAGLIGLILGASH